MSEICITNNKELFRVSISFDISDYFKAAICRTGAFWGVGKREVRTVKSQTGKT